MVRQDSTLLSIEKGERYVYTTCTMDFGVSGACKLIFRYVSLAVLAENSSVNGLKLFTCSRLSIITMEVYYEKKRNEKWFMLRC
ncbi:MAG: hypothetical protein LBB88_07760 [Planctomycetaceae bacterium]|jgi:hypothetical protein|nr:hypothetical protein [Planctomycetaceae bacterium]